MSTERMLHWLTGKVPLEYEGVEREAADFTEPQFLPKMNGLEIEEPQAFEADHFLLTELTSQEGGLTLSSIITRLKNEFRNGLALGDFGVVVRKEEAHWFTRRYLDAPRYQKVWRQPNFPRYFPFMLTSDESNTREIIYGLIHTKNSINGLIIHAQGVLPEKTIGHFVIEMGNIRQSGSLGDLLTCAYYKPPEVWCDEGWELLGVESWDTGEIKLY